MMLHLIADAICAELDSYPVPDRFDGHGYIKERHLRQDVDRRLGVVVGTDVWKSALKTLPRRGRWEQYKGTFSYQHDRLPPGEPMTDECPLYLAELFRRVFID